MQLSAHRVTHYNKLKEKEQNMTDQPTVAPEEAPIVPVLPVLPVLPVEVEELNEFPVVDNVADVEHSDYHKREDETQAEYNERVPVGLQPVLPGPTLSYLGNEL